MSHFPQEQGSPVVPPGTGSFFFKFKLYCDRQSVGQFVLWCRAIFFDNFFLHVGYPLWQEDRSVICSAITHWLESHKPHNHILLSHLGLSQPGGPGLRIYISQEQGGPVIPPGTGFPFCCLLRLAGQWQRCSIPPPHGRSSQSQIQSHVTTDGRSVCLDVKPLPVLMTRYLLLMRTRKRIGK
jgi:hypothetical protein